MRQRNKKLFINTFSKSSSIDGVSEDIVGGFLLQKTNSNSPASNFQAVNSRDLMYISMLNLNRTVTSWGDRRRLDSI